MAGFLVLVIVLEHALSNTIFCIIYVFATGPYRVLKVFPHSLYECASEYGVPRVFHVSRLIAFVPRFPPASA